MLVSTCYNNTQLLMCVVPISADLSKMYFTSNWSKHPSNLLDIDPNMHVNKKLLVSI